MTAIWSSPRTWTFGELATESILNTHIRDNEEWLFANRTAVIYESYTVVGNVGGGSDPLMSYTMPGGTLDVDGKGVRITGFGTFNDTAASGAIVIGMDFGAAGIAVNTGLGTSNTGFWRVVAEVIRKSGTTQVAGATMNCYVSGLGVDLVRTTTTTPGETLSGAVVIRGRASAVNNNDIVQQGMIVEALNIPV